MPGELIANGSATLPPPAASENHKPERTVEIDVPELGGVVRMTYNLKHYRHHKSSRWSWLAVRADAIRP